MSRLKAGGGWPALFYTLNKALEVGPWRLWKKMRSANACKTCAVGMGGQLGGMVNEAGHFPEVCKKSLQAQAADMKGSIDEDYFDRHDLNYLLKLTPKQAEDTGRLSYPLLLKAGSDHFEPVSWENAISITANALKESAPQQSAFYASGRSSNEAAFLLQSFARVYGTNNVMNCSYYCHQASGVALKMSFGSGTATVTLNDLDHCDLLFVCGSNPASNHPRIMTQLANLRARGGEIVVVNPVRELGLDTFHVPSQIKSLFFGSKIASRYIQPLAGGDVAFWLGVLKALIERNQVNQAFLQAHTENSTPVLEHAQKQDWSKLERSSGVSRTEMEDIAELLAKSKSAIFAWAMGLTHHLSGVDNVLALCNVALATGNVGRKAAGLLPLRGHSNVQGVGSVGFAPALQEGVKLALQKAYGRDFPDTAGYDTFALMEAAARGEIKTLIALGGNLWGSNPNSNWAASAMQKIGTVVYLSTKLNPGHFHGRGQNTLILPVLARDEEPQTTTQESMFNFVRLSDGGSANAGGSMRAETAVICDIAQQVLGESPVNWNRLRSHHEIRQLIADTIPGWSEIKDIDTSKREFTVAGRIFHSAHFNTISGKAQMHVTPLPELKSDQLRLITLRSEGQFNTVVYEEGDIYRGMPHRHCILLNKEDALKLKLKDGQRVSVHGEAGTMENIEVVFGDIKAGVAAMFYPEANILIKGQVDPRSGTPNFKSAPVWIKA